MRLVARLFVLALLPLSLSPAATHTGKPNILFILADDQSWEALGILGSEVKTPNLDRLARQGTLFPRAYNMGAWNGAVCIASRTMFNTGLSVWACRDLDEAIKRASREGTPRPDVGASWSQRLARAGYRTYFAGKWHVALFDPHAVFDVVGTIRPGMPRDTEAGYNRPKGPDDKSWLPWDRTQGGHWEGGKHWSEVLADEGTDFLRQAAGDDQPFFMYLAFNAPHDPRQSPKRFVDMYPVESIRVPENFLPDYPWRREIGLDDDFRDERLAPHPRTEYAIKVHRQEYYAIITHMDEQIGRILDTLEATGQAENTVIFFTADHGLAVGHHGFLGKQNMYEHSLRAPLIIAGPGLPRGQRLDTRVYIQDIVPTTLALAGAPPLEDTPFANLLPVIRGEHETPHDRIYGAYVMTQRATIDGHWKIIYYPAIARYRLFDLQKDPLEMHDLAEDPRFAAQLTRMKARLQETMAAFHDPLLSGSERDASAGG